MLRWYPETVRKRGSTGIDDRFYRRFHELWLCCGNAARSRAAE
jgi:hypothetical protein